MNTGQSARLWLQEEYDARRKRNPSFSLRAFAQVLQIPPGRLSEILNQKRPITHKMARHLADRLELDPQAKQALLNRIQQSGKGMAAPQGKMENSIESSGDYIQLSLDHFHALADWYHFAILSLTEVRGFKSDAKWIAQRLGISVTQVKSAIERLTRLDLLVEKDGAWVATNKSLTTPTDIASPALRSSHRQSLRQAIDCLETVELADRDITSITMAIDRSKIEPAKKMIRTFRRQLCAFLEEGEKTEVYNLNVQLVPVSQIDRNKRSSQ
ncbi:MAG: TIGR02147 family protein [Bdellovibrionaceae bacterium]|nr:TIGR02147 family protein [Bdellovibrionales bacterium]MCB9083058.1 TIGR02147 family protein [Pseudobdellovibrionaceae bacterium]